MNKPIGDAPIVAESWEVVDHGQDQSIVQFGPLANQTLGSLINRDPVGWLGKTIAQRVSDPNRPENLQNRFPLLFKFLDANQNLSVQVHPDDRMGATLDPPDLGKTEAWYVMDAEPGSKIYAGLQEGVTREEFETAISENRGQDVLHCFEPNVGDTVFIPAGTVHALGAGLLIAEIQQCSNTTFRLYDWGRVDTDGNARELHIEKGLDATHFEMGPVHPQSPQALNADQNLLVDCDKFRMCHWSFKDSIRLPTLDRFQIVVVLEGEIAAHGDLAVVPLRKGDTILIPACMEEFKLDPMPAAQALIVSGA